MVRQNPRAGFIRSTLSLEGRKKLKACGAGCAFRCTQLLLDAPALNGTGEELVCDRSPKACAQEMVERSSAVDAVLMNEISEAVGGRPDRPLRR